jgi:hypothetical protein
MEIGEKSVGSKVERMFNRVLMMNGELDLSCVSNGSWTD